jgi:hypothetical protein
MPSSRRRGARAPLTIAEAFDDLPGSNFQITITDMPGDSATLMGLLEAGAHEAGCKAVIVGPGIVKSDPELFFRGVIDAARSRFKLSKLNGSLFRMMGMALRDADVLIVVGADSIGESSLLALAQTEDVAIWLLATDAGALIEKLSDSPFELEHATLDIPDHAYAPGASGKTRGGTPPVLHTGVTLLRTRAKTDLDQIMADGVCVMLLGARLSDTIAIIQPGSYDALNTRLVALGHVPSLERA